MSKKLSFFDKLLGVPNDDKISKTKYRLKIVKYILTILGLMAISAYYGYTNVNNRTTSFTNNIEPNLSPPILSIFLFPNKTEYTFIVMAINVRKNFNEELLTCNRSKILLTCYSSKVDLSTVYIDDDGLSFGLLSFNGDYNLKQSEVLYIDIYTATSAKIPIDVTFGVDLDKFYYIDTFQQATVGLTKKIVIKNGEEEDEFSNTVSTSRSLSMYNNITGLTITTNTHSIFYSTNVVVTENTQSNFEIAIEILSSIGSVITFILMGTGYFITYLSKLLIKDKSGWIDQDLHSCITYHYDQVNLENLEKYKLKNQQQNDINDNGGDDNKNKNDDKISLNRLI